MVKKLLGMPRGWSRHASAFVISTLDLSASRVPTMTMNDSSLGLITVTHSHIAYHVEDYGVTNYFGQINYSLDNV